MKLLVVVDVQKDFIDGALYNEDAIKAIPNISKFIKEWDGKIVFTKDTHFSNTYASSQEGKRLPYIHCVKGTEGWEINSEVVKAYKESHNGENPTVIQKYSFGLYDWLSELLTIVSDPLDDPITEIVIIGFCTDICVVSNAMILKALLPEAVIKIKADCCAGLTPEKHAHALDVMQSCQMDII